MFRYFIKSIVGHFRTGKSLHLLTVFGVALGVASVISIRLISTNAISAFAGTVQAVSGNADVTIVGAEGFLSDTAFVSVLSTPGVLHARPTFRIFASTTGEDQSRLEILGVDLLAPISLPVQGTGDREAIGTPGWIAVTPQRATANGWIVGDTVQVFGGGRTVELVIGGLVDFRASAARASSGLAVMDIAEAQELFGGIGLLHQIDVSMRPGTDIDTLASRLQSTLGPSARTITPERRVSEAADLLEGFSLNLTALSLVTVFVGLFLVYSSTQAGLVRRRTEHGVLRCLGASRTQLILMVLAEVTALGIVGVAVGVPLGYWAAASRIDVVNAAITNLYLLQAIEQVYLDTPTLSFAVAAGLGGAIAGALMPAIDISRRDTRSLLTAYVLRNETAQWAPRLFAAGLSITILTIGWYATMGHTWRPSGFVLAFAVVIVLPLITPFVLDRTVRRVEVRSFGWSLSIKTLAAHLHTTSLTVAALSVAVTIMVGVTVMVSSFRITLEQWIDSSVNADVYVAAASGTPGLAASSISNEFIELISNRSDVLATDRLRRGFVFVSGRRVVAMAVDAPNVAGRGSQRFSLIRGSFEGVFDQGRDFRVLISEPLARKHQLSIRDTIDVAGSRESRSHIVAGVYYEYGNESGTVVMSHDAFSLHFTREDVQGLGIYLRAPEMVDQITAGLREEFASMPVSFQSNSLIKQQALRIFDQTFAITRLLRTMTLVIAIAGITLTLLVLTKERISELALYRALGGTPRQIFLIFLGKGVGLASFGFILGTIGGSVLAVVLVYVVNRAYFGWTIQLYAPWIQVIGQFGVVLLATSIAGVYPAWRAANVSAAELNRENV